MPAIRLPTCWIWFYPAMNNKNQNLPYMALLFFGRTPYNETIITDNRRKTGCVTDILITTRENM